MVGSSSTISDGRQHERHGQGDPLLLAPGKLVRVAAEQLRCRIEICLPHDLGHAAAGVIHGPGVDPQHLPELMPDA